MKSNSIVFAILTLGGIGALVASHLYGEPRSSQILDATEQPHLQVVHKPGSCKLHLEGQTTEIELYQGRYVKGRWVSCQRYEGHPVLLYGDESKYLDN